MGGNSKVQELCWTSPSAWQETMEVACALAALARIRVAFIYRWWTGGIVGIGGYHGTPQCMIIVKAWRLVGGSHEKGTLCKERTANSNGGWCESVTVGWLSPWTFHYISHGALVQEKHFASLLLSSIMAICYNWERDDSYIAIILPLS